MPWAGLMLGSVETGVTGTSMRWIVSSAGTMLPRTSSSTKCAINARSRSPKWRNWAAKDVGPWWRMTSASDLNEMLKP